MFPHERKLQQLQQQRQLVEQLRREAAINRINVSQVRVSSSHPSCGTWQQPRAHTQLVAVIYLGSPPALGLEIMKNVNNNSNYKFLNKGFELQSTKIHHLKDSFTTFPKHSLFIWFQACKDLQKYCTEHQNEDFLIKGFASQKQNPFREKSSCAVLWEHYNFNVFVLYIYL